MEAVKTKSTQVFLGIARKQLLTLFQPTENTDGTPCIKHKGENVKLLKMIYKRIFNAKVSLFNSRTSYIH